MKFKKTEKCDKEVKQTYMVMTSNMEGTISEENRLKIFKITREKLGCKGENEYGECVPDFLIFDPKMKCNYENKEHKICELDMKNCVPCRYEEEKYEDEGRSLHIAFPELESKVYVKLDDFGSKETLKENVGHPVNTRFLTTLMLAEDY